MQNSNHKKWGIAFFLCTLTLLIILGSITAYIDPYFHYTGPKEGYSYPISNQRYQNDGIMKHFTYDAMIIGTSMTQNFKTSEFDRLFQVNSIKVPFNGATYREINDNLKTAVEYNDNLRVVLRCLDYYRLLDAPDNMRYDKSLYPTYLYDKNPFNDVSYLFNKTILFGPTRKVLLYTDTGRETTDFDSYGYWQDDYEFGKDAILKTHTRKEKADEVSAISDADYQNIFDNITGNVTTLAEENPQIDFYLYFPPYSIYYWDDLNQLGTLEKQLDAEKYAIELLLRYENIHLFSFHSEFDLICDPDNYKDYTHYGADINAQILRWMKDGEHLLTTENYEEYCDTIREFYTNYDYDTLYQ